MANEEYIQNRLNEILADSNSVNDDRVVNYVMENGQFRAVTAKGEMGAARDSKEEALQTAVDHFKLGQKIAETPEQKAALLQLAQELKTYGGAGSTLEVSHVIQAATGSSFTNAVKTAVNMSSGVGVTREGRAYTSYGSNVDIILNNDGNYSIVSPEGVAITQAGMNPETVARFGLDPNKVRDALIQKQSAVDAGRFGRQGLTGTEEVMYQAFVNNAQDQDIDNYVSARGGNPADFNYLKIVANSAKTAPAGFSPNFTKEAYVQRLNEAFDTPNNNINFGESGLQYTYDDGTSVLFDGVLQNTNFIPAINKQSIMQSNPYNEGFFFIEAKNFTTAEAFDKYLQETYNREIPEITEGVMGEVEQTQQQQTQEQQAQEALTQTGTPTPPQGTPPVGAQTYPSYSLPEAYAGTGGMSGQPVTPTEESTQESVNRYGTLPFQYTPTTQYTIGQGGVTGQTTPRQTQTYEVRQFRNATGLTTSITFVNGRPTTIIPSGFYPVEQQPQGVQTPTVQAPQMQTTSAPTPTTVQAPTVQAPPVPASSQIPTAQAANPMTPASGTPNAYTPQFMQQPVPYQMAVGGSVQQPMTATNTPMIGDFAGFRPEAMQRIANSMGYQGDMNNFNTYLQQNPAANQQMNYFTNAARRMAKGGVVKAQQGVDVTGAVASGNATRVMPTALNQQFIPQQEFPAGANLPTVQAQIAKTPGLPTGATVVPVGSTLEAGQLVSPYSGQVSGSVALPTAQAATTAAAMPQAQQAAQVSAIESTQAVSGALQTLEAAQGSIDPRAEVLAAQQTASSVGNLQAAQGNAILMDNPVQRQIQDGELISAAANAQTASTFTEQVEAATATPTKQATVQGQLEGLMAQFEGGNTPAWAAGSMRTAMATLAARGLGASSLAGQAVIQAAMESALPIAQMDAQTMASFEVQNLSNRQQRAMLAAQQRAAFLGQEFDQTFQSRVANAAKISDVANMNFTAEQQVALENSRIANTVNLQNLNNRQAMVMAEAAALANLDMQNLNNRQQSAVQNAQNFLSMDMANLSNQQQTDLFKAQQRVQSLFTDQAAQNAAQQFNASSQNQVDQFFASLATQTAQFNATQANAQSQFNAGQVNTIERFNAEINNQRDQFNAQNRLIIDQSNAQWRREIATADTAAVNRANEINATALIGLSQSAYNNLWQYYRDNMEWAWTSAENERQRITNIGIAQLQADSSKDIQGMKNDYESSSNFGSAVFKFLTTDISNSLLGGLFG